MEWVYAYKRDVIPYLLLYWVILVYSLGQRWYVQTLTCRKEKDENKKKKIIESIMAYDTSCVTTHMSWFYEQISFMDHFIFFKEQ